MMKDPKIASVVHVVVLAGNSFWDILSITRKTVIAHNRNESQSIFVDQCNEKESKYAGTSLFVSSQNCFPVDYWKDFVGMEWINNGMKGLGIKKPPRRIPQLKCQSEGLHFSVFLKELLNSDKYRFSVFQQWILKFKQKYSQNISEYKEHLIIWWTLKDQIPYIIDDKWCVRMNRCAQEWQHLDSIMSWLSTLGGACSALGDYYTHFAERAWAISLEQMAIALRLGDPNIISRCRLYAAVALIQQCKFKLAAVVIKTEYQWVKSLPGEVRDQRLVNMCHGIWTKLRHERKLYQIKYKNIFQNNILRS